jgi:soluble lytic murein transglycosylase-like protein
LAYFFNRCQGAGITDAPLSASNVRFVNYVFGQFKARASESEKKAFFLDRQRATSGAEAPSDWKRVLGPMASRYALLLESTLDAHNRTGYYVDPLLFVALIRQESNFRSRQVSPVGAAGLTQMMPRTAKQLGMRNIYMPAYLDEARSSLRKERKLKREALELIQEITEENQLELAGRARGLMQNSLKFKRKRIRLYTRYRRELIRKGADDRLNPKKTIPYGLKYFASLMEAQAGDMSLALASYNAGPHRIRRFQGIPPYTETVSFRNRVLKYYRSYQRKLRELKQTVQGSLRTNPHRVLAGWPGEETGLP